MEGERRTRSFWASTMSRWWGWRLCLHSPLSWVSARRKESTKQWEAPHRLQQCVKQHRGDWAEQWPLFHDLQIIWEAGAPEGSDDSLWRLFSLFRKDAPLHENWKVGHSSPTSWWAWLLLRVGEKPGRRTTTHAAKLAIGEDQQLVHHRVFLAVREIGSQYQGEDGKGFGPIPLEHASPALSARCLWKAIAGWHYDHEV